MADDTNPAAETYTKATDEALELIDSSILHDRIARADYTPALAAELESLCDDWVNADELEYWGTEDGETWRVHLTGV